MELVHIETNRGKRKCYLRWLYSTYRLSNILKSEDIVYRCSAVKTCKASLTTDPKGLAIVKTKNAHNHEASLTTDPKGLAIVKTKNAHNHEADDHKAETHQLRVRARHNSGDISQRSSKVIRSELQKMDESLLNPKDLKNVAMSMYRERRKQFPKLLKSRTEVILL